MTASWLALQQSPIQGESQRNDVAMAVMGLTQPAPQQWVMARIASLLSGYYASDVPASIVQMDAEDWAAEVGSFPQWAIQKAVRWWRSAANDNRRKKPMPGDIAARADLEMAIVRVGQRALARFDAGVGPAVHKPASPRTPFDREKAAQIVAESGCTPKRMQRGAA